MANLLPKAIGDFSTDVYWKQFFTELDSHGSDGFEWYGAYSDLQKCLEKYLKPSDKILQVGCGNSLLADNLYDNGYRHVVSVDIIDDVIRKQRQRNKKRRPELVFEMRDATANLSFSSEPFNVVLDKGTLDALLTNDSPQILAKVHSMFAQVEKNLGCGGRYVVVSLAQNLVIAQWISYFTQRCLLRVHYVESEDKNANKYAVFLLIATKLKDGLKVPEIYEFLSPHAAPRRCSSMDDLLANVQAVQEFSYFCHKASAIMLNEELQISLFNESSNSTEPVYNVILVHKQDESKSGQPYGVFIVPKGNEKGYFYSTPSGRQELCKMADFRRLAIITQSGATNKSSEDVKTELNRVVLNFAPSYLKESARSNVPYLSIGADQCQDEPAKVLERFHSEISGDFEIIEVPCAEDVLFRNRAPRKLRQLIFCSSRTAVQSEIKVDNDGATLDWSNLACLHHRAIVASLAIANADFLAAPLKICLIGLGGGCLAMFLRKHFPNTEIIAIELDPVVVDAAKKWFGFEADEKLSCTVADGIQYLQDSAVDENLKCQFDVVIFDVAGSEAFEGGLTCPPPVFLTEQCLGNVKQLLKPKGVLALNLVVRCKEKSSEIKRTINEHFETVMSHPVGDDTVNELLVCLPYKPEDAREMNDSLQQRLTRLHEHLAEICQQKSTGAVVTPSQVPENSSAGQKTKSKKKR